MPDSMNVELALVAVTTAWSGYQAARWEGDEALLYSNSSTERFDGEAQTITAANLRQEDLTRFSGWLQAQADGNTSLADVSVRRMRPDYRVAFDAWLKTDPLNSPQAPPSPSFMPEYRNVPAEEATRLADRSRATFTEGTAARHTADDYVRNTILLARVLFLVAVAQRFKAHWVRVATNVIALALAGRHPGLDSRPATPVTAGLTDC
jgi:hypothetical protein